MKMHCQRCHKSLGISPPHLESTSTRSYEILQRMKMLYFFRKKILTSPVKSPWSEWSPKSLLITETVFGLRLSLNSHWPPPGHPMLTTLPKSSKKCILILGKIVWMIHQKDDQVDSIKDMGYSFIIKEKFINYL